MHDEGTAPEADVAEQRRQVDDGPDEELEELAGGIGEKPEADALEQAEVVEQEQTVQRATRPADVAEADWLEQSIAEAPEDERR